LQKARRNEDFAIGNLKRVVRLEFWLRRLVVEGVLTNPMSPQRQDQSSSLEAKKLQAPVQPKSSAS
jgi:hypothetical protein